MSKTLNKVLALVLALAMAFALVACQTTTPTTEPTDAATTEPATGPATEEKPSTLVVGYSPFSEKFSPFFAKTAYDQDAYVQTQVALINNDRAGNLILKGIEGETVDYNGKDYFYDGIADTDIVQNDDGTVDYNIKIRDDIVFSDGTPMTIDDVIFNMYVLSDPTYDGSSTFYAVPIEGMAEYRAGMELLSNMIVAAGPDNTDFTYWTEDEQKAYWDAFWAAGEAFAQEIADYCKNYGATNVSEGAALWGFEGLAADATAADFFKAIVDKYGYDVSDSGINAETAGSAITDLINAQLGDKADAYAKGISTGESAANIAGIKKTGDYSMTVHCTKFEATAIYQLGVYVAPMHYYGDASLYDYDNNSFGFPKGDLSLIRSKTTHPMGAGPYVFEQYENGVITYHANELYYKGTPKTQYLLFQEGSDGDKLAGVVSGQFDITDPSFSQSTVDSVKEYNGGELTGSVITTDTVDNLGYGYIGVCAATVNVGGDKASDASKDLRKAFATLFSVYRDTVINSYYGERASVIQYPISNTSWAAPRPADEGYEIAYSKSVEGNPLYTEDMSEEQKYDAALAAAVGYLKAAGFTYDEAAGKFTAAPDGASLVYEVMIPADGIGDHPAYGILTNAKEALAKIGITLEITDLTNSSDLWTALESGNCQMWAAAWGATIDPDMYQVYHSSNIYGLPGSTESNHYSIQDAKLDELIMAARESADQSYRKATYKQCLDIILDWGVEIPTYQRQNAIIFSTERVNMETMTPDITTFYGWFSEIENIEVY
ncbi:MAG: ABC transporter substrate-binding protein [Eubacteriales bacterium]|nr:ABC transporter substrate-binding protein [Eubacteriales bacterium]